MEHNNTNPNVVTATNILIYKESEEANGLSLFKLKDWRVGHAVELQIRRNWVTILDCPSALRTRLLREIGGTTAGQAWDTELTVAYGDEPILPKVIMTVKKWVDEQE